MWSFAGEEDRANVNAMTLQPFVNYNLPKGWYLTSSPLITANWEANDNNRWTLPIGGGIGRIGRQSYAPPTAQARAVSVESGWRYRKPKNVITVSEERAVQVTKALYAYDRPPRQTERDFS